MTIRFVRKIKVLLLLVDDEGTLKQRSCDCMLTSVLILAVRNDNCLHEMHCHLRGGRLVCGTHPFIVCELTALVIPPCTGRRLLRYV